MNKNTNNAFKTHYKTFNMSQLTSIHKKLSD